MTYSKFIGGGSTNGFKRAAQSIVMTLALIGILLPTMSGCRALKDKPAPFKKAVYLSSSAVGLSAIFEMLVVLERNEQISAATKKTGDKIVLGIAKAYQEVDRLLFAGDINGAQKKIIEIIASVKSLQDQNAFQIVNAVSREWFYFGIEVFRTGITALSNFIRTDKANVEVSQATVAKLQEANLIKTRGGVPTFIVELINVVISAQTQITNLTFLDTAEAVRAEGQQIARNIISKLEPQAG